MTFKAADDRFAWLESHLSGWQFGEQGILKAIVDKIGLGSARMAEVGAGNGTDALPLTLDCLYQQAYRITLYEMNAGHHAALKERYPKARIEGECRSLWPNPYADGVVIIDVDSNDWYLFANLLANKHLPRVVMVEHRDKNHHQEPIPLQMKPKIQATSEQLAALADGLMTPVGTTQVNSIFVRNDMLEKL